MLKKKLITAIIATAMFASSACAMAEETKTTTETTSVTTNNFETWYVNAASGLNCRSTPEVTNGNILTTYKHGTELQIIGIDDTGKWWQTWDGEIQGWCHSAYFVSEEPKSVTTVNGTAGTYLGRFKITHYCPCYTCNEGYGNNTAWAGKIIPGQTIAVDPSVIGKLQQVYIEGYGVRRAEDCGGGIRGNHIDMAVPTHQMAEAMGVVYRDVYLVE